MVNMLYKHQLTMKAALDPTAEHVKGKLHMT